MKSIFIFLFLVVETFLFTVFTHYQFVNPLKRELLYPEDYPIIGNYLPNYFYWGSLCLIILFFIAIVIILFLPKEKSSIILDENKGKLELTKNAIRGLVKAQLNQTELVKDAKIKVKMKTRRIDIKIIGNAPNSYSMMEKSNQLVKDLEHYMINFLGLNVPLKINILFNDAAQSNLKKEKVTRVI